MAAPHTEAGPNLDRDALREQWLARLAELVRQLGDWARDLDWSTRTIEKPMEDSQIGAYMAPALILQKETTRILLEPIARSAPGAEGVVDLYRMPAFDDIASLFYYDGRWQLHYRPPGSPTIGDLAQAEHRPLSRETLRSVLEEMTQNAA